MATDSTPTPDPSPDHAENPDPSVDGTDCSTAASPERSEGTQQQADDPVAPTSDESNGDPSTASGEADAQAPEALSETDQALLELTAERDQYKDIALRLQADFENFRKRVAKDHENATQRATEKLAEALLPVLDACEAAFVQHPAEIEPIFNLMLAELRKQGLEGLNLQDQPFNPEFAEAVLHEPGDDGEPVISEVLRSGYTWKGKVLRPAMVKVRG